MVWKNTIATDQTDVEPPSCGSTMRVNIGWTANNSSALVNTATVNAANTSLERGTCAVADAPLAESIRQSVVIEAAERACVRFEARRITSSSGQSTGRIGGRDRNL